MSDLMMTRFAPARPAVGLVHLADTLMLVWRTWRTRRALMALSERELKDIGLSRAAAIAEASRLPWDTAPIRW